jgi:hypothetical protein
VLAAGEIPSPRLAATVICVLRSGDHERYAKLPFLKFLTCDDAREKPGFE